MATHSSVLAWRIPGTGEPGGLPSLGSHRVGHDWSDLAAAAAACMGWESWTIKKAECQRIDAFKFWYWRRLLRVPWTAERSNQSILKESTLNIHWKDWCWSWSSNTLATWCEKTHWKNPTIGKIEGRRRGWQRMKWLDSIIDLMDMSLSKHREIVKDREAWHASVHRDTKNRT